ncbi:MAG: hypothetical protein BWY77_00284 [bacterium ADurb.Bin431]|nr:MAG: hypothetical protein BWY77_00284 [bacterium ADurb.Bin431]
MNPRLKERLVGVDVAHPDDDALIHDDCLDHTSGRPQALTEILCSKSRREGFNSQFAQHGKPRQFPRRGQIKAAETARIAEMELTAFLEMENDVGMEFGRMRPVMKTELSAHAQMDDEGPAAIEMPDQVLGAPLQGGDALPRHCTQFSRRRKRTAQFGRMNLHPGKDLPGDVRGQTPADRLDFRQLRHLVTPSRPKSSPDAS